MKPYLLSLAVGLLVGIIYGLVNVRSPAPPVIALLGLLGILAGEQVVPLVKRVASAQPVTLGWVREQFVPHMFGSLPVGRPTSSADPQADEPGRNSTNDLHAS